MNAGNSLNPDSRDYAWMLKLLKKLQEAELPERIEDLNLDKLGINKKDLEKIVAQKRREWVNQDYLKAIGIAPQYLELCLMLYSYSLQEPAVFGSVNTLLNSPQKRTSNDHQVMLAMPWVKGVDTSLTMLPKTFDYEGPAYRGTKHVYEDLLDRFRPGTEVFWYTFKSFSTDPALMKDEDFCGEHGERTIVKINNFKGKMISKLSAFPDESEVLGRPGSTLMVRNVKQQYKPGVSGDPFKTADIIEFDLVHNGAPDDALLHHCMAHIDKTCKKWNVSDEPLAAAMTYEKHASMVTFNGPTKSGKSTLVNAFLEQVVTPTGDFPCTVVPTVLYRTGLDEKYFLTVRGHSIDQVLTGYDDLAFSFDTCDEMFGKIKEVNADLRTKVPQSSNVHLMNCEDWHFEVRLPGQRSGIVLCDCGGGSEGGLLGHVISKTLTYRVTRAATSILVVDPRSLGSLTKPGELENYLGAASSLDPKKCIIAVNKTDNEPDKAEAQKLLNDRELKRVLKDKFPAERIYFVSAKHLLSKKLLEQMGNNFPEVGSSQYEGSDVQTILQMWMPDRKGKFHSITQKRLSVLEEDIEEAFVNSFDTATLRTDLHHSLHRSFPHALVEQLVLAALFMAQDRHRAARREMQSAQQPLQEAEQRLRDLESICFDSAEKEITDPLKGALLATSFVKGKFKDLADFFDRQDPLEFSLDEVEQNLDHQFADAVRRNCDDKMSMSQKGAQAVVLSYSGLVKELLRGPVIKASVEKGCEWLAEKASIDADVFSERLFGQLHIREIEIQSPGLPPPQKVDTKSRFKSFGRLAYLHKWDVVCESWEKLNSGVEWKLGGFDEGCLGKKFFSQVNKDLASSMAEAGARAASEALQEIVAVEKESLTRHMQDARRSEESAVERENGWRNVVEELKSFHGGLKKKR